MAGTGTMQESENARIFGVLLRQYRLEAGLTQEALAERAGLGTRSIQHLERGEVRPQRGTARRLAVALALAGEQRSQFEAQAQPVPRRRATPARAVVPLATGDGAWGNAHRAERTTPMARDERNVPADLDDRPRFAHNLPCPVTSFIGRKREIAAVTRLLSTTRLLTLTGAGGCGKTRLALQVATGLLDHYAHDVWLIELAPLSDPTQVPLAVATALGLREEPGQLLTATLTAALRPRHALLVLDNCEHLMDACATVVATLLRACPDVQVLATSREALRLAGETAWRVPSLDLPDAQQLPPPATLVQVEAVRLFVERAVAVQPHFALTMRNAPAVAQLCQHLDGIPLAIELVAARVRGLSVDQLARRLDQRFHLLTGGNRAALPRQQTLRATIDWSYDLLNAPEQTLFTRLCVFAGSFTIEAVEALCAGGEVPAEDVLDVLLRLVDKSLVVAEDSKGDIERYRLLETLRQYGRERSVARGDVEGLQVRHAAYYRTLAEDAALALRGPQSAVWLDRLEAEHGNLHQALRWAIDTHAAQDGLRLVGALTWFWHGRGYWGEGQQWAAELLALPGAAERTSARARALSGLATLRRGARLLLVGSHVVSDDTVALVSEAASIARELADRALLGDVLFLLGNLLGRRDYPADRAIMEECLAL